MPQYRNKFEEEVGAILGNSFHYERHKIPYVIHRNYIPDFVNVHTIVECKGFFREGDVQKYRAIRNSLVPPDELIFVLYKPTKKVRKNGKITMSEWCEKEGFKWCTLENIKNVITT